MRSSDLGRLTLLGALWGGSFIFMRVAAPAFGPLATANIRVVIASFVLLLFVSAKKIDLNVGQSWGHYLITGALNSAIPFSLFCWAETRIEASTAAIINATTPIFGMLVAAIWIKERITIAKLVGALIAFTGVSLVVGAGLNESFRSQGLPVLACLTAAFSYGVAATYIKWKSAQVEPLGVALGSQISASILLLPIAMWALPHQVPSLNASLCLLALGVLSTGAAYALFFRLVKDIGPIKTMTVTFLAPIFGLLWSFLFLGESITVVKGIGAAVILVGTYLVTRPTRLQLPST